MALRAKVLPIRQRPPVVDISDLPRLLTIAQVAARHHVSRNTIHTWIKTRGLRVMKDGRTWLIREDMLDEWERSQHWKALPQ